MTNNTTVDEILDDYVGNCLNYSDFVGEMRAMEVSNSAEEFEEWKKNGYEKGLLQAKQALRDLLLSKLPSKQVQKWDDDYHFCETCEAFLEDNKYKCYRDIKNEILDEVINIVKGVFDGRF